MKKISFPLLFFGLVHGLMAQTNAQSEAYWGALTTVTTSQQVALAGSQLTPTAANQVLVSQQGINNQLNYVNTSGQANNRAYFKKKGDNNRLSLSVNSTQNTYLLEQMGNGNELQLSGIRVNGAQLDVRQTGNNNSLISTGMPFGGAGSAIKIEQFGGAHAIVTSTY